MPNFSKDNTLPTLARRLLHEAAAVVRKKRTEYSAHLAVYHLRTPPITSHTLRALAPVNTYRIAMISEVSEDEVVVISALAAAPFCCHADLLTMSAPQLITVAQVLNDALPLPLRINLDREANYQPGEIRAEIEIIVGLRSRGQPMTPVRVGPRPSGLSQLHLEPPVTYHGQANGDSFLGDTNYDGDISASSPLPPKRRHILRTSAQRTVCAPTTPQVSPSPIMFDRDEDASPSFVKSPGRHRWCMGQVSPRMSTPVNEAQMTCQPMCEPGLEGFPVEDPNEWSSFPLPP